VVGNFIFFIIIFLFTVYVFDSKIKVDFELLWASLHAHTHRKPHRSAHYIKA